MISLVGREERVIGRERGEERGVETVVEGETVVVEGERDNNADKRYNEERDTKSVLTSNANPPPNPIPVRETVLAPHSLIA